MNKVFIVIYTADPVFKNMSKSISYYYCNAELAVFRYYTMIKEDVSFKLLKIIVHSGLVNF